MGNECERCGEQDATTNLCDNCITEDDERLLIEKKIAKLKRKIMIYQRRKITNLDQIKEYFDTLDSKWKVSKYELYVEINGGTHNFKNFVERFFKNKNTDYRIYLLHDINENVFYIKLNTKNRINVKYCSMCKNLSFGYCKNKDCFLEPFSDDNIN